MTDAPDATFPFSAVVAQDDLKLALLLATVDPAIGGVLVRGQKGSAKTTLARALASLLGGAPFVELPLGATEDRVVGSLDLAAVLASGEARFQPGLLHAAHGGVLYVDEVNLLPDHLVDVLLDVASSGVNRVEREGVSRSHPSRFVLVGSMNPEEGELRPQLLDRFGLAVEVAAPNDPDLRAEAVRRRLEFDADPRGFRARWAAEEEALAARLAAVGSQPSTTAMAALPDALLRTVSAMCAAVGAEGLRADLVTCRAAAALAGWEGRAEAGVEDVRRVAPLALAHRRRRSPFEEPGIDQEELHEALRAGESAPSSADKSGERPGAGPEREAGRAEGEPGRPEPPERPEAGASAPSDRTVDPASPGAVVKIESRPSRGGGAPASGRRSKAEGPRGRLVGDRAPTGPGKPVAAGATVRAAAVRRASDPSGPTVVPSDLREAVREQRAANLVVLAVDASASMGAERRMEAAKGAVLGLLLDAYQRRDRVALVTFRDERADVVLRPTGSVEVARARLARLPTGGRTPLAAGILSALAVSEEGGRCASHRPLLVLVSDGRATAGPEGVDPVAAALEAAERVRRRGVDAVVVDTEDGPTRLGLARAVAEAMAARYLTVPELSPATLSAAVAEAARRPSERAVDDVR